MERHNQKTDLQNSFLLPHDHCLKNIDFHKFYKILLLTEQKFWISYVSFIIHLISIPQVIDCGIYFMKFTRTWSPLMNKGVLLAQKCQKYQVLLSKIYHRLREQRTYVRIFRQITKVQYFLFILNNWIWILKLIYRLY